MPRRGGAARAAAVCSEDSEAESEEEEDNDGVSDVEMPEEEAPRRPRGRPRKEQPGADSGRGHRPNGAHGARGVPDPSPQSPGGPRARRQPDSFSPRQQENSDSMKFRRALKLQGITDVRLEEFDTRSRGASTSCSISGTRICRRRAGGRTQCGVPSRVSAGSRLSGFGSGATGDRR